MKDVVDTQIRIGTPNLKETNSAIGKPQIATLSIAGDDLGFADVCVFCLVRLNFDV